MTPEFIEASEAVLHDCHDVEIVKTYLSAWMRIGKTLMENDRAHLRTLVEERGQMQSDDINETARNTIRWLDRLSGSFKNGRVHG